MSCGHVRKGHALASGATILRPAGRLLVRRIAARPRARPRVPAASARRASAQDLGAKIDLLGKSAADLRALMAAFGEPAYRGTQLYKSIYAERRFDFAAMSDLPAALRERLAAAARIALPEVTRRYVSADGSVRYLLSLAAAQAGRAAAAPRASKPSSCRRKAGRPFASRRRPAAPWTANSA